MKDWLKRFGGALDWPSNVSGRGTISDPFGDWDKDGVPNMNDCEPKNPKKQDKGMAPLAGSFIQQERMITSGMPTSMAQKAEKFISIPDMKFPVQPGPPREPGPRPTPMPIYPGRPSPPKEPIIKFPIEPGPPREPGPKPTPMPIPLPPREPPIKFPIQPGPPREPGPKPIPITRPNYPGRPHPEPLIKFQEPRYGFGPSYHIDANKINIILNDPNTSNIIRERLATIKSYVDQRTKLLSQPAYPEYDNDIKTIGEKIKAESLKLDPMLRQSITGTAW